MWRTLILMPLRVSFLPEGQREDSLEVWSKPKQVNRFLTERALPEEFLHQAVEALNPAILCRLNGLCSVRDEGQHWGVLSHTEIKNENRRRPGGEDKTQGSTGSTNGSLVCTFLHQTEELLRGAVVAVLLVQLFHCGQKLINDGLQLCAAYHLTTHTKIKRAQSLQTCWFYTFSMRVMLCVNLNLLQQSLYDAQQDVPCDHLELFAVFLNQPGDGEDDLIRHHLVGTWHGLKAEVRRPQLLLSRSVWLICMLLI